MNAISRRVADKAALITGAGSGIGRATASLMAQEGAVVLVADIDMDAARRVAHEVCSAGGRAEAVALNVADESAWRATMDTLRRKKLLLSILVNNAGISISKCIADLTVEEWRMVMAVNVEGVFLGTKYAINAMKGGGSIVNVASVSGIKPSSGAGAYCASKAALRMLTKTAAIECADAKNGIRVNVVTPGGVKTPMWQKEEFFQAMIAEHGGTEAAFAALAGDTPSHQFYIAEVVAETILYLSSDQASHLTGTEIILDRGHTG